MNPTTSTARVAANQANAALSTGPRTVAGKLASRRNALKHGLTSKIVDLEALEREVPTGVDADGALDPNWLKAQITLTMTQIQRGQQIRLFLQDEAALRASTMWDEDRTLEAALIGERLAKQPGQTVARLQVSPHGCEWLIERWGWLARAAQTPEGWSEDQTQLAFGLLGVGEMGRTGTVMDAVAGRRVWKHAPPLTPLALAEAMIAELGARHEVVAEHDALKREMAIDDATDLPSPELARIRRYDTALHKRLQWLLKEQRTIGTDATPTPTSPTPPRNEPNARETNPTPRESNPMPRETNPTFLPLEIAKALPELAWRLANPPELIDSTADDLLDDSFASHRR